MYECISVIGGRQVNDSQEELAHALGAAIVERGYGIVCGGHQGVMESACKGAAEAKSRNQNLRAPIIGILMGENCDKANPYVEIAIPTGMGVGRNILVVRSGIGVIAIGGMSGTLSEIALAWQLDKPIAALAESGGWTQKLAGISLDSMRSDVIFSAHTPAEAIEYIILSRISGA